VTLSTLGNVTHNATGLAGIRIGTGAAWFDYNRDGDLDLYMTNRVGAKRLWRNDGGGAFGAAVIAHDPVFAQQPICA
jgi:hypothetical protein